MSGQVDAKDQIDQVELANIERITTNVDKEAVIRHVLKSEQDRLTAAQTVWRFKKVSLWHILARPMLTLPGRRRLHDDVCRRRS